jgi:hypothetical protein
MNLGVVTVAQRVCERLAAQLGEQLVAFYLYGSAVTQRYIPEHSDINLLAVIQEDGDMAKLRAAFRPLWADMGGSLLRPPAVATTAQLSRHLQLQPLIHHHLATFGRLLHGRNLIPPAPAISQAESWAYWSQQALEISPILAPNLLENGDEGALTERLRRLSRQLDCPVSVHSPLTAVFAHVQVALQEGIGQLADNYQWRDESTADAPPLLDNLQAIYEVEDGALLIFPHMSLAGWEAVAWPEIAERLAGQYRRLWAATGAQFRLSVQVERPLYTRLRRFNHIWGRDILADLPLDWRLLFRQAARLPSGILINNLPQTYLGEPDEEMHTIIHDFQNRLLNIQLQHELLIRLHGLEAAAPPDPLPGRERPSPERIAAIFNHFDWWAEHYAQLMRKA